jgi:ribosomal protein L23
MAKKKKPKRIRAGKTTARGTPRILPTTEEVSQRIEECKDMLLIGMTKSEIKAAINEKYGIEARQCEDYLSEAKKRACERTGKSRKALRNDSYALYMSIATDETAPPLVRIKAQERVDRLLGLESPQRKELSGPGGEPLNSGPQNVVVVFDEEFFKNDAHARDQASKTITASVSNPTPPDAV